jgi:signal transduction histidine kinase
MSWSVRRRLTTAAVVGAAALTSIIGLAAMTESWRRSNAERSQDLEFAIDRVALDLSPQQIDDDELTGSDDEFVAVFDAEGALLSSSGDVDPRLVEELADEQLGLPDLATDEILFDTFDLGVEWDVAAVRCPEADVCHSVVLGRRPTSWSSYVVGRLPEALGALVMLCAVVALGAAWLVTRSLRPVDRMRRELDAITAAHPSRRIDVPDTDDELSALAGSMNATVDRLADSLEAQRRFVSDSAHELRSPLTGLRATLELAQLDPARADLAIPQAIAQVDRTTSLIDDLLQLARDDAGVGATRRLTDVDDLVRTELRDLATRRPNVEVRRGPIEPVQVMADPGGIARVVRNLLDNAAVHGRSTVRAALTADDAAWTLTVDDDGPGIPPADREAVFERFHRLDQSRSRGTGGTGLGLAIVAGVVAAHRGTITVGDSDLGGARMTVRVPRQPD